MIHTIGDSHGLSGFDQIKGIKIHHLGPVLMYSVTQQELDFTTYQIKNNDIVITSFGEIDCRCHIHKYKNDYKSNIVSIIDSYINKIKYNLKFFDNIKINIYNIVPPCREITIKGMSNYPTLGSDEERQTYVLYMNKVLKEQCNVNRFSFFDIYDKYCDRTGFLNKRLSGHIHISNPIYIKEYINMHFKHQLIQYQKK